MRLLTRIGMQANRAKMEVLFNGYQLLTRLLWPAPFRHGRRGTSLPGLYLTSGANLADGQR